MKTLIPLSKQELADLDEACAWALDQVNDDKKRKRWQRLSEKLVSARKIQVSDWIDMAASLADEEELDERGKLIGGSSSLGNKIRALKEKT